jgi:5-methylcytosine-specific restriction endonuclease McrA
MTRRRTFTKAIMREALARSGGKCEAVGVWYGLPSGQRCNADLSKGVQYDHVVRFADGGESDLTNCAAVCIACHKHKTAKVDTPGAAKTKRMSDKARGIRDAPKMKGRPMATTPKAASRKARAASKIPVPDRPRQLFEPKG